MTTIIEWQTPTQSEISEMDQWIRSVADAPLVDPKANPTAEAWFPVAMA
jgi:hypothetical protein